MMWEDQSEDGIRRQVRICPVSPRGETRQLSPRALSSAESCVFDTGFQGFVENGSNNKGEKMT